MSIPKRPVFSGFVILIVLIVGALAVRQLVAHDAAKFVGDLWVSAMSVVLRIFAAFFGH